MVDWFIRLLGNMIMISPPREETAPKATAAGKTATGQRWVCGGKKSRVATGPTPAYKSLALRSFVRLSPPVEGRLRSKIVTSLRLKNH